MQYLFDVTITWLAGILAFDLLLRRDTFHAGNRAYLLLVLLAGAVLPLIEWQQDVSYPATLQASIQAVGTARHKMAGTLATLPASGAGGLPWPMVIYLCGAGIALALLAADVLKVISYARHGKSHRQGMWRIIETGRNHSPFSVGNTLFVAGCRQYTDTEWRMILAHEGRHSRLWHFADLMLLHALRIIFWFHPLVYIYHRRLLMVHEYQADKAGTGFTGYGSFLVEQSLLGAAPYVAHSFNRSPIKNRLLMLNRTSIPQAAAKWPLTLLAIIVSAGLFCNDGFAKGTGNGRTATWLSNKVTYEQAREADTIIIVDPVNGEEITQVRKMDPEPVTLNGKKIYTLADDNVQMPQQFAGSGSLEQHIFSGLSAEFSKLPDGSYHLGIQDVILDEKGKVAFCQFTTFYGTGFNNQAIALDAATITRIRSRVSSLMKTAPAMSPARFNGKAVAANIKLYTIPTVITVHAHQVTLTTN